MTSADHLEPQQRLRRDRSRRVVLLSVGVVILSLADLLVTLLHLKSSGMMEANPIAAWIIGHTGSVSLLAAFKAATVGVCVVLLYRLRRHVEGEVAAWCAVMILAVVSFNWYRYTREIDSLVDVEIARQGGYGEQWLMLD